MAKKKSAVISAEENIVSYLNSNGIKFNWLAEKIECSPGHLHFVLCGDAKTKRTLTEELKIKINNVLKTTF